MDTRLECNYKDKCYRKKYDHFEKFKHPHLDELLEKIGNHQIHVPFGYIPNVAYNTLKLQLEMESKIRSSKILDGDERKAKRPRMSVEESNGMTGKDAENSSLRTDESSGISPVKSSPAKTQHVDKIPHRSSQGSSCEASAASKQSDLCTPGPSTVSSPLRQLSITPGPSASPRPNNANSLSTAGSSHSQAPCDPGSSKKTFEKQRVSTGRHSANMSEAEEFRAQVKSRIHKSIGDKLRAAAPYNILYTTLEPGPYYKPDHLSVTFPELLDSPLGLLEDSLLLNFMVQFGWLLACYFTMGHSNKPMTLLYGEIDTDLGTKFNKFLTHVRVKPPSAFGSHHTKMMIFQYLDKSIRVVISTANLVESDWVNRTQGVWISDKCEELLPDENDGDSLTHFKRDLLAYLKSYNLPQLQSWIDRVTRADMSHINVFFVASVPGSHQMSEGKWGQGRLRSVLRSHAPSVQSNSYRVIAQISSIGSLGPAPDSWLLKDILTTFSATKPAASLLNQPPISVIYPSFSDVESSADGLLGGGCLPYSSTTHRKQEWLSNYLNHWKSDDIDRTKAVPHIKSYTRVSPDNTRLSYFLLTSANLSKAAWGTISKAQTINILSYEAGVLLLPEFILGSGDYLPLTDGTSEDGNERPKFTLPYDLPLTPYSPNDIPWFIDNLPS